MSKTKQIPALPPLNEAPQDDDRLVLRDTSSGSDVSLRVDRLLERSAQQVDSHATETGGVHGIPAGERAIRTDDLGAAPNEVPTNQQLADGVERGGGNTIGISSVVFAKEIPQGIGGNQVLLLCRATERAFISGTITGSRRSSSGAANRASTLDIFVRLGNDGSPSIGFVTGGGFDGGSIDPTNLITTEYDNETYIAIRAEGAVTGAGFDYAIFTGVNTNGVFQWVDDDDALNQQDFSGSSVAFFGRPGDPIGAGDLMPGTSNFETVALDGSEIMIDGNGNVVEA